MIIILMIMIIVFSRSLQKSSVVVRLVVIRKKYNWLKKKNKNKKNKLKGIIRPIRLNFNFVNLVFLDTLQILLFQKCRPFHFQASLLAHGISKEIQQHYSFNSWLLQKCILHCSFMMRITSFGQFKFNFFELLSQNVEKRKGKTLIFSLYGIAVQHYRIRLV